MYQALYRKWRPRTFDDVVGQAHITDTLKRQIESDRLSHAYLFTGTRGTGKTTCAKILARAVNCEHPINGNPCNQCPSCLGIENGSILDVLELDAASNNGVDQVRALRDEAVYTPAAVKKRVYIIDEVHMLSTPAFNALLKILEEPPSHLMFVLATTELHKVPTTIKSRCQQFSFKRIQPQQIKDRLQFVAEEEHISLSQSAAALLARLADGGLRDALSLLDQCAGGNQILEEQDALNVLGLAGNLETARLLDAISDRDTGAALQVLDKLYREGKDMGALLGELSALCRDILILKTTSKGGDALLTGGYDDSTLKRFFDRLNSAELIQLLSILQNTSAQLYRSGSRRTDSELCIIRMCERGLAADPEALAARITRLEEMLAQNSVSPSVCRETLKKSPVSAPQQESDLPPWNLPDEQIKNKSVNAEEFPKPNGAAESVPETEKASSSSANQGTWETFSLGLRGKIPPSAYTFISKPNFVTGIFDDTALTIWADSEMTKGLVSKPEVLQPLETAAKEYTGRPIRITVRVGKPEPMEEKDKLNDLLALGRQFGNIKIK